MARRDAGAAPGPSGTVASAMVARGSVRTTVMRVPGSLWVQGRTDEVGEFGPSRLRQVRSIGHDEVTPGAVGTGGTRRGRAG